MTEHSLLIWKQTNINTILYLIPNSKISDVDKENMEMTYDRYLNSNGEFFGGADEDENTDVTATIYAIETKLSDEWKEHEYKHFIPPSHARITSVYMTGRT